MDYVTSSLQHALNFIDSATVNITPLQKTGLATNCIGVLLKDNVWGFNGRKIARVFAITALALFCYDRGSRAIEKQDPVLIGGTIALAVSAGRAGLLLGMADKTDRDKQRRRQVAIAAFALGAPISVGAACIKASAIDPLAVSCIVAGMASVGLADLQQRQRKANMFYLGSAICFGAFAAHNHEGGIMLSNMIGGGFLCYSLIRKDDTTRKPEQKIPYSPSATMPTYPYRYARITIGAGNAAPAL